MPKMKTHTGAAKRFKVTGSGKLVYEKAGMRHNLEKKSSRQVRRKAEAGVLGTVDSKRINKLLGR